MLRGCLGGGEVVAGSGERFGQGGGFLEGFGGLGLGGDGGCFGAAPCGFGVGDLRADSGGVQAGGLVAGGSRQDGGLPDQCVEVSERVGFAGERCAGVNRDAGVVVETAWRDGDYADLSATFRVQASDSFTKVGIIPRSA